MPVRMPWFACALLIAGMFAGEAPAAACRTLADLHAAVTQARPQARAMRLEGAQAQAFLAAFNRIPPPTEFSAEEVLIVFDPGHSHVAGVVLAAKGCATQAGRLPAALVRTILGQIGVPEDVGA